MLIYLWGIVLVSTLVGNLLLTLLELLLVNVARFKFSHKADGKLNVYALGIFKNLRGTENAMELWSSSLSLTYY